MGLIYRLASRNPTFVVPSPVGSGEYWIPLGICPLQPEVRGWQVVP